MSIKTFFKRFFLFNEIAIFISWLCRPVRIFCFRSFKIKDYPCIFFNKDIFNYCNRKSDVFIVQIESLLAVDERDLLLSSLPQNSPQDYFFAKANTQTNVCSLLMLLRFSTKDFVQIPFST